MKHIVSNAMAFQGCEAPGAPVPGAKPQNNGKGCVKEDDGFADKLRYCKTKHLGEAGPPGKDVGAEEKDNGMRGNPGESMVYGIVGILEGFEPPGYQPDNEAAIIGMTATAEGTQQQTSGRQGFGQTAMADDKTPTSEQIAWMLNMENAGKAPAQTQEEVLQIVGEYLDSLENTSKTAAGTTKETQSADLSGSAAVSDTAGQSNAEVFFVKKDDETAINKMPVFADRAPSPEKAEEPVQERKPVIDVDAAGTQVATENTGSNVKAAAAEVRPEAATSEMSKPESVRESVMRIVDKVSTKAAEGKYDFDIDLKPEFMGKVSIKLTMKAGELKVHIKADDMAVKAMLLDQTSSLSNMLKDKGIAVSHIDVMYEGSAAPNSESHARQGDGRQPQGNAYRETEKSNTHESARERYDFYLGNSCVEYLA